MRDGVDTIEALEESIRKKADTANRADLLGYTQSRPLLTAAARGVRSLHQCYLFGLVCSIQLCFHAAHIYHAVFGAVPVWISVSPMTLPSEHSFVREEYPWNGCRIVMTLCSQYLK